MNDQAFNDWYDRYFDEAIEKYAGLDTSNPKGIAQDAWEAAIEADRQRRGEPWMPIESCPGGNGVRYLFVRDCGEGTLPAVEMGYMLDSDTEVYMDSTHKPFTKYGYRVTHWMPLPGLPNTPQPAEPGEVLSKDEIREVFLANGFTIKPGHDDLKPYVYAAAREIIALAQGRAGEGAERRCDRRTEVDA